jgi:NADPH-dependent curcumin reductase CurA
MRVALPGERVPRRDCAAVNLHHGLGKCDREGISEALLHLQLVMRHTQRQLIFAPRAGAALGPELFELREAAIPQPGPGQVLIRTLLLSCDPAQVGWLMSGNRYAPKIVAGDVMRAWGAGHVVASRHPDFQVGDRVWGTLAWQEYVVSDGTGVLPLQHIPHDMALSVPLGVGGINGMTAYIGIIELCATRAGELVVVSSAAGATGGAAVQIARGLGARVVGIAGGPRKQSFVRELLGAVDCIDYKAESMRERCPPSVDVYFDNVGGATLDALMGTMADNGRIALCGASAQYAGEPLSGASLQQVLARTLRVQGFVLYQYAARFAEISAQLFEWVRSGQLHAYEDLAYGLEAAPSALQGLFRGQNIGKQLVVLEGAAELEPKLTAGSQSPRQRV